MLLQISSGNGPEECSIGVEKLALTLQKEYPDLRLVATSGSPEYKGFRSAILESEMEHQDLVGTVQWNWQSTIRPGHKRKNWFLDVSIIAEAQKVDGLKEADCRFETFRSGGKGGQNVNKVETGIRIVHIPTGIRVECTEERSQFLNKHKGLKRLAAVLKNLNKLGEDKKNKEAWNDHWQLQRGKAQRVYEGWDFRRKK